MTANTAQAFVLHTRPYRNTSLLVEFWTLEYGRLSAVARGAKRPQSAFRGILQPFQPLWIAYSGRGSLYQCQQAQSKKIAYSLPANAVYSGLYLNELMIRLLPEQESLPALFESYEQTLEALQVNTEAESALRRFEKQFLQELGYGLNLQTMGHSHHPLEKTGYYGYDPANGFFTLPSEHSTSGYSGDSLLKYAQDDYGDPTVLAAAKQINRRAIDYLLGDKSALHSRQLWQDLQRHKMRNSHE